MRKNKVFANKLYLKVMQDVEQFFIGWYGYVLQDI